MTATAFPHRPGPDLVLDTLREHAASLLGTARRYSICTDDAHDAYQRAVEIFLKRAHRLDRDGALPWLRTVVKHEALAVRAARQRLLGGGAVDLDARENREAATPEECAADADALTRSAEALQRLKPQEVRALLLKAQGHSYKEIGELTGWSYTKVNRCLTEGRRRFLERYAAIESGAECERWADVLSALVDGEASSADLLAVRPHLRNCPACRARIREFRRVPRALGAVMPVAALALHDVPGTAHHAAPRALGRAYEAVTAGLPDRMIASAQRLHAGLEAASSGKLAAVAMSATALGGGVAAVDDPPAGARHRVAQRSRTTAHVRVAPARATGPAAAASRAVRAATDGAPTSPSRARSAMPPPSPASRAGRGRSASEFGFEGDHSSPPATRQAAASGGGAEFGGGGGGPAVAAAEPTPAAGGEFGP
ncbi:MAG TPA: sigma-70 family RNA polymerase sigma factor [Solirubrobacteraceae bacterium]|nr:sigma-70 family RNA polymerase sigma factor [Solirubrobacteraceae bacterium]